jgi:hypothetical protein
MQGDAELYTLAGNRAIPVATRVMFAAMARGNIWGHAGFAAGELARIIRLKNNRATLNKAIRDLASWGVAAPESTSRCIVLSAALYRRGDSKDKPCEEPSHQDRTNRMWLSKLGAELGHGWESEPGDYQKALDRGAGPTLAAMRRRVVEEETETVTTTTTTTRTRTQRRVTETEAVPEPVIQLTEPMPERLPAPRPRLVVAPGECLRDGCTQLAMFGSGWCVQHHEEFMAEMEAEARVERKALVGRRLAYRQSAIEAFGEDDEADEYDEAGSV